MAEEKRSGNQGKFAEDRKQTTRSGYGGRHTIIGNFADDRVSAAEAGRKHG